MNEQMRRSGRRRRNFLIKGLAFALAGVISVGATACQPANPFTPKLSPISIGPSRGGDVGTNVGFVGDWSSELPFVDVIKSSRTWTPTREGGNWGQGGPLAQDADGWITRLDADQFADIVMLNDMGHYPAGRWTLLYEGAGTLRLDGPGVDIVRQDPGRWEVDLTPHPGTAGMLLLRESATDPTNPIRNIRFVMPGFENTYRQQPFNPVFLDTLRQFNSLRFLAWTRTQADASPAGPLADFRNRTTVTSAFQSDRGVALEYMIQLANTLRAEPWFNIPFDATNDHVTAFATMVRQQLDPSLRAWVEYSNEMFDPEFAPGRYAQARGDAVVIDPDPGRRRVRYSARRSLEIFDIWNSVFGGHDRFVRVLTAWSTNPWAAEATLDEAGGNERFDSLAIGPYVWCDQESRLMTASGANELITMSDDVILRGCLTEIANDLTNQIDAHRRLATAHGLPLVAYEGGQHLRGIQSQKNNTALNLRLGQVSRSPGMRAVYDEYFRVWRSHGGERFINFYSVGLYTVDGSWGSLEWQDQDRSTAPKFQAVEAFSR